MKINKFGLDLIKQFESLHDGNLKDIGITPKADPVGIFTEGYGRAMKHPAGGFLTTSNSTYEEACRLASIKTVEDAEKALLEDTEIFGEQIKKLIRVELNDNQFSACVSLAYNIGVGNFKISTVLRYINQKQFKEASDAFVLWNKGRVNNKLVVLKGLTRRREAEKQLFLKEI